MSSFSRIFVLLPAEISHQRLAFCCSIALVACGSVASPTANNGQAGDDSAATDVVADANAKAFIALPLAGCGQPGYTVAGNFGGAQTFPLTVDTGSSSTVVAETGCATCTAAGLTSLYQPGSTATDTHQTASAVYSYGELGWTGEIYRDSLALGGAHAIFDFAAAQTETAPAGEYNLFGTMDQACDTPNSQPSHTTAGILGLAPDAGLLPGTMSYLDGALGTHGLNDVFAMQLSHFGGTLWLGGYDARAVTSKMRYTAMTEEDLYRIDWVSTEIDDAHAIGTSPTAHIPMPAAAASTFVDSGGNAFYVPLDTFTTLSAAIEKSAAFGSRFSSTWFSSDPNVQYGNCVDLAESPEEIDAALPVMTFTLGEKEPIEVKLTATDSYLAYYYDPPPQTTVQYCQRLMNWDNPSFDMGQSFMIGHVVVFDRANKRMGFAEAPRRY